MEAAIIQSGGGDLQARINQDRKALTMAPTEQLLLNINFCQTPVRG